MRILDFYILFAYLVCVELWAANFVVLLEEETSLQQLRL